MAAARRGVTSAAALALLALLAGAAAASLPPAHATAATAAAAAASTEPSSEGQCSMRPAPTPAARKARQSKECSRLVHQYMSAHTGDFEAEHDVQRLVFFLHVPRTAGKTYANCFLRTALPPSRRCAKSYDGLRLNVSTPGCLALISHDDFSATSLLPPEAATITQLRRPVDRVLSAYEFSVDVAARGLRSTGAPGRLSRRKADWVGTLSVWPWSVLIPWFKQDMRQRLAAMKEAARDDPRAWRDYKSPDNQTYWWNEARNESVWVLPAAEPVLQPYNNSLVMPLHEWIEHPIAAELLHNGATLQLLGLTNYSHYEEAAPLRACLRSNSIAREMLLALATRRLGRMAHVGLTERLDESVLSMAADLGWNLSGPAYKYTSANAFSYDVGAEQDDVLVWYNATTAAGEVNVTATRREAAARANAILDELRELRRQIDTLLPQLAERADEEAAWLDKQDWRRLGKAGGLNGIAGAVGYGGGGASSLYAPASLAPRASASLYAQPSLAPGAQGGGGGSGVRGAVEPAAVDEVGNVLDGNTEMVPHDEDSGNGSSGASGSDAGGGQQAAAAGAQPGSGGAAPIDSPWAKEIERLDALIAEKQEEMRLLEAELSSIHDSNLVVLADDATGRARQLIPDEHYRLLNDTLGHAYQRCAHAGHTFRERRKPYKELRTPWGETIEFGSGSRHLIPRATLDRIQQLNGLDEELWKAGDRILTAKLEAQRAAAATTPPPHPRRRALRSMGGTVAAPPLPATPAPGAPQQQQQQQQQQPAEEQEASPRQQEQEQPAQQPAEQQQHDEL